MYSDSNINDTDAKNDLFMKDFKLYRQFDVNRLKEDDCDVLNISDQICIDENYLNKFNLKKCELFSIDKIYGDDLLNYGLKSIEEWCCFEFIDIIGLYLIKNPFKPGHQRFFIKKCLTEYHDLPNKTNLDAHMKRDSNLWQNAINKKDFVDFNKLRWATVGYHYDWTNKIYDEKNVNEIPNDIQKLTKLIATAIGYNEFRPEAGIINYYHLNSTLSAHQDHSEKNMDAPLISVSFGSSAIFLIGDSNKSVKPKAICLKSGDIVVMSKKSRLSYHAVPKIFKDPNLNECLNYIKCDKGKNDHFYVDDSEWSSIYDYIKINRINLNIRQVF